MKPSEKIQCEGNTKENGGGGWVEGTQLKGG